VELFVVEALEAGPPGGEEFGVEDAHFRLGGGELPQLGRRLHLRDALGLELRDPRNELRLLHVLRRLRSHRVVSRAHSSSHENLPLPAAPGASGTRPRRPSYRLEAPLLLLSSSNANDRGATTTKKPKKEDDRIQRFPSSLYLVCMSHRASQSEEVKLRSTENVTPGGGGGGGSSIIARPRP